MATSAWLWQEAQPIFARIMAHPFVRGLGDGTLPQEKFRFYLCQDYVYLIDYCRVFALAAAKADDLDTMKLFGSLLSETLHTEMDIHRRYAARFGMAPEELERTEPAPVTASYTSFLLKTAYAGTIADILAAVLSCQWSYHEIALRLKAAGSSPADSPYNAWIDAYAADEFGRLGRWLCDKLDALTAHASEAERARLRELFVTAFRFEYLFWEMAWQEARWPL